jgi:N-acetylmuramoyl-L-alanine amidase
MANKRRGVYDPGAVSGDFEEASIVMIWANELRAVLKDMGHYVCRTRVDELDPCPVGRRDDIARAYRCDIMLSLHCNAANGKAHGTETFYRGAEDKQFAEQLNAAVCDSLGTRNRGVKTEKQSQHPSLAVLDFPACWLIELGFIDHIGDRAALTKPKLIRDACAALARVITNRLRS